MKLRTTWLFIILIIAASSKVNAGWYQCYNYTGAIGDYPITLSLQITPGFFGEKDKEHFNINGVYKYEKYNNPIKLEGHIDLISGKGILYEVNRNKYTASFAINFAFDQCSGLWTNLETKKGLPFQLTTISSITDTAAKDEYYNVDILQTNSLGNYYFVGVYMKRKGADRAVMNQLKIIEKSSNRLFQTIDFSAVASQTGNVATVIFDNVTILRKLYETFIVTNNVGRAGGYLKVRFKSKEKKFVLNPEPVMEGSY